MRRPARPSARRIAVAGSLLLHAVALWAFLQSHPAAPPADPNPMLVYLLPRPSTSPPPPEQPLRRPTPRPRGTAPVPHLAPRPAELSGPALVAPPAAVAASPGKLDAPMAHSLRARLGCEHAELLGLTDAEQQACVDALAAGGKTAPLYAVISPHKKAIFDGDCPEDDDWCLYRIGKGPYPGLLGLGGHKHHEH
jgi:hypothetical protein